METRWLWKPEVRRAGSAILATLVGLCLVLPLLMISSMKSDRRPGESSSMVVMSLTKPRAPPQRSIPEKPAFNHKFAKANPEVGLSISEAPSAKDPGASPTCELLPKIATTIQDNAAALQAIENMPPDLRSLSDAIMLWNGQWADPLGTSLIDPVMPIRSIIEQVILTSPMNCQLAAVTGPLFMAIRHRDKVTMLVIGSGVWHWNDLTKTETLPAAENQRAPISK